MMIETSQILDFFSKTPLLSEITLVSFGCIFVLLDVFLKEKLTKFAFYLTQTMLFLTISVCFYSYFVPKTIIFNNMYIHDELGALLKSLILILAFFGNLYGKDYLYQKEDHVSEFYILSLFSLLGMMVMVSCQSFLSLYLGVELMTLPLYALLFVHKNESALSLEAGVKYFVMSAVASAIMLYGISFIYGVFGSDQFQVIANVLGDQLLTHNRVIFILAIVMIFVGIGFKFAIAPFHVWLPDLYEGAPIIVTSFFAVTPKVASFAVLLRMIMGAFSGEVNIYWQHLFLITGFISVVLGTCGALAQNKIRRLLAYSTISHVGYILLGLMVGSAEGYSASLFYLFVYSFMMLGFFGGLVALSNFHEIYDLADLKGLVYRNKWLAFIFMIICFSLAGIPPFVGFLAKFFIFKELFNAGYIKYTIFILLITFVGAYYYLRIVKEMYFNEPDNEEIIVLPKYINLNLAVSGLVLIVFSILPDYIMQVCRDVFGLI